MIHNLEHFANMCKFPTAATQSLLEYEDYLSKNHAEDIFMRCRDILFRETEDPWKILDDYGLAVDFLCLYGQLYLCLLR